jgi:acetyl esterase/lipase
MLTIQEVNLRTALTLLASLSLLAYPSLSAAAPSGSEVSALGAAPAGETREGIRILPPQAVWPQGIPDMSRWPGRVSVPVTEEFRGNDQAGHTLWNVTRPSFQPFLPSPDKATGAGVIVAPGGGFRLLSIDNEGNDVARWFAAHGVAAFVLKYRLIQTLPGETAEQMRQRVNRDLSPNDKGKPAVDDGLETLRQIRAHASEFGVDPQRIGTVGFSAGGHVAGMMALAPQTADRPDFIGLIYGMPFSSPLPPIPAANLPFPPGTPSEPWLQPPAKPAPGRLPPMFMAGAQDDVVAGFGFRGFYEALHAKGYRPELHLYERGGHGFGARTLNGTSDHWLEEFLWWIEGEKFID